MFIKFNDGVIVRDSIAWDISHLAENMRLSDVKEVYESHHHSALKAATLSFYNSTLCYTVEHNGKLVMMFGACPYTFLGSKAAIWMLATKNFDKIHRKLIRHSRGFVRHMLTHYSELDNYVSCDNILSVKWLKWMGATLEEPKPFGIEGRDFIHFTFRRPQYAIAS